ncbi:MAG: glycerol kinase [Rickettsiales bacterium]|nr:glycerol kinase [Rickettsiales bacterium]
MSEDKYLLSIDQGTTSSRAILFDSKGRSMFSSQEEFKQYFPSEDKVEHDPKDIWDTVFNTISQTLKKAKIKADQVSAIGITNQRETTLIWDKETGEPVYNAIVWQDRRTSEYCAMLKEGGHEQEVISKTGLLLDPYFSATKIKWILDNVDGARNKAKAGKLLFGTVDCYLLWKLTEGRSHYTDISNASRTLLFNIHTQDWDDELLKLFDIPSTMLPEIKDNICDFGVTTLFGDEIPIYAMAGDQQAASFGQACFDKGMVKSTYGTGCFMLKNIGSEPMVSKQKLLTTIAWRIDGKTTYALEGSIFVAGSAIQFMRDVLGLLESAPDSEKMAQSVDSNGGIYFVPALTGLGAPYWNPYARGLISGLTRGTKPEHIVRAALEAQAYQTLDLLNAMQDDTGIDIKQIRVDGGLVNNSWVCQFISDIVNVQIDRPVITETTALGVAYMAGLKAGFFKDFDHIKSLWLNDRSFKPEMDKSEITKLYNGWQKAIERVQI